MVHVNANVREKQKLWLKVEKYQEQHEKTITLSLN